MPPEAVPYSGGLKVIGTGLGRTGTSSLKKALEILYNGAPCYHMTEVIKNGGPRGWFDFWVEMEKARRQHFEASIEIQNVCDVFIGSCCNICKNICFCSCTQKYMFLHMLHYKLLISYIFYSIIYLILYHISCILHYIRHREWEGRVPYYKVGIKDRWVNG